MDDQWVTWWVILGFMPALLGALTIKESSTDSILHPKGDSVSLSCTYVLDPTDIGVLDIEWSKMNPDTTGLDDLIITYMDKIVVPKAPAELVNRLSFKTVDPSQGDATITITYLDVKDSGTYQCKVKKNPGVATRKVALVIQAAPTNPHCFIEGELTKGSDAILKCKSSEGTPPLTYKWEKIAGPPNPATPVINMAPPNGDLLIKNISDAYAGAYQCTVGNKVGSGTCVAHLSITAGNRTGIIVGAVIGALLLLLLLLLLIWCLICRCNKKRYEKEIANDVREDVAAPPSNSNSRASSLRSAAGYRSHNIRWSSRRSYNAAPKDELSAPSLTNSEVSKKMAESPVPLSGPIFIVPEQSGKYHPYNLQRVGGVPVMVPAQSREGFIV
ncbi:coxsackievirus and adenovirus receptor homolog [Bufo gargarizans]|uniref:coxsackievirus and adenovirus receptor homolog n=1 Tax=Bufo gargarizans TaxID=30331 RepID=UPI001CF23F9F|nr:coxsackievirus and adenovirus receptor homolog [Bufo gargarizans]